MSRKRGPKTQIIAVPINRLADVQKALGRTGLAGNQTPIVKIRVPAADVERIRGVIKNDQPAT